MSNDPRNAEFSFLDFAPRSHTPGPADHQKNGSAADSGVVTALRVPTTDAADANERRERDRGSRRLAYCLLAFALGMYGAWAFFAGFLP